MLGCAVTPKAEINEILVALGATLIAVCGAHFFARITRKWYIVVGPGPVPNAEWVLALLPKEGNWWSTWDSTDDDYLVIHYREES